MFKELEFSLDLQNIRRVKEAFLISAEANVWSGIFLAIYNLAFCTGNWHFCPQKDGCLIVIPDHTSGMLVQ